MGLPSPSTALRETLFRSKPPALRAFRHPLLLMNHFHNAPDKRALSVTWLRAVCSPRMQYQDRNELMLKWAAVALALALIAALVWVDLDFRPMGSGHG
jgi:hypothetical protein